ncbi:MAG: hypothetical protein ABUS48_06330 [Pseudomonadota bacterium]
MDVLIAKETLEGLVRVGATDEEERAYAYYCVFNESPNSGEEAPLKLTAEARFYNRYFWFGVLAKLRRRKSGYDAGMEQQHFQMLETAPPGVDLNIVEALDVAIAQE